MPPCGPASVSRGNQPQADIVTVIDCCDEVLAVPRYRVLFERIGAHCSSPENFTATQGARCLPRLNLSSSRTGPPGERMRS